MRTIIFLITLFLVANNNINCQNSNVMDKIITQKAILNCDINKAFAMFTKNSELKKWLTIKSDVEPKVGGKYELFWEPNDPENNSTIGCKILAFDKPNYLNFEWKGPKKYKKFMNTVRPLTNITVMFSSKEGKTIVTLVHTGWREGSNWEEARQYFVNAWKGAFLRLENLINFK